MATEGHTGIFQDGQIAQQHGNISNVIHEPQEVNDWGPRNHIDEMFISVTSWLSPNFYGITQAEGLKRIAWFWEEFVGNCGLVLWPLAVLVGKSRK